MQGVLRRLIIAVPAFIIMSIGSIYLSGMLHTLFSTHTLQRLSFDECIAVIQSGGKCFQMWALFELVALTVSVMIVMFRGGDYYKSVKIKITNKISIPAPAGQGQHGSAWFASKKELKNRFLQLKLNKRSKPIQAFLEKSKELRRQVNIFIKTEDDDSHKKSNKDKTDTYDKRKQRKDDRRLIKESKKLARKEKLKGIFGYDIQENKESVDESPKRKADKKSDDTPEKSDKIKAVKEKKRTKKASPLQWRWQDMRCRLTGLGIVRLYRAAKETCAVKLSQKKFIKNIPEKTENGKPKKEKPYFLKAGLVINVENGGTKISCIGDDKHALIVGSTSSGKSRRLVVPTICTLALAGENMVITDPKGELNAYTSDYLESLDYNVTVFNFFDASISSSFNPLQPIIDAVNDNDLSLATSRTWDLTSFLVERSDRSEPIWRNGEMSVIAAAILCVVYDNQTRPEFQNLTNVYWFIFNMCKDVPKKIGKGTFKPIVEYVRAKDDSHPAKPLLGISEVAPDKTAGSFYTSALTTLRLFTSEEIYGITNSSSFELSELGKEKQALFFVLPDSKTTYYPIVSLICSQIYDTLTETAKKNGNRLQRRVNFLLDEFGNFAKITDFTTMLTVGRGYGIRYNLFVQSFAQLEEKYEKTGLTTIQDNCLWLYLSAGASETNKAFEERLGKYTISSYSLGGSTQHNSSYSSSSNVSLTGRSLLSSEEIGLIENPYMLLVENQQRPAVTVLPDLSKWLYNDILGLGDVEYNKALIRFRTASKEKKPIQPIQLWGIWDQYLLGKDF